MHSGTFSFLYLDFRSQSENRNTDKIVKSNAAAGKEVFEDTTTQIL
jgi:hypothetical protein